MGAPALADTAKIEFDGDKTQLQQSLEKRIDHFIVHGPAIERMRMRHNRNTAGVIGIWLGQDSLQFSRRSVNQEAWRGERLIATLGAIAALGI